jgi:hemerythrin-like metal-binding protein
VNEFAEKNDSETQRHVMKAFLDTLDSYCTSHFALEEQFMEEALYPMLHVHKDTHIGMKEAVFQTKMHLVDGTLTDPYTHIVNLSVGWLSGHIAKDDMYFSLYCKNKDKDLGRFYMGRRCEIMSSADEFLCEGKVESVEKSEVAIMNHDGNMALLQLGDAVKVLTYSESNEDCQIFHANVRSSTPDTLLLYSAAAIKLADNQRNFFRVETSLPGTLVCEGKALSIVVLDVSTGGLMIEVDEELPMRKVARIKFAAEKHNFEEPCLVTRKINLPNATRNTYGIKFISLGNTQADWISSFVLHQQALARRRSEKKDSEEA